MRISDLPPSPSPHTPGDLSPTVPHSTPTPTVVDSATPERSNRFTATAATSGTSIAGLEKRAIAAEKEVLQAAQQLNHAKSPKEVRALQVLLQDRFVAWQNLILPLVKQRAVDSPAVKSFTSKVEQANLISQNVP